MKLHTAEINALENRINDLGGYSSGTVHLQRKLEALKEEDAKLIDSLVPSAIRLIESKMSNGFMSRIRYKKTKAEVLIVKSNTHCAIYLDRKCFMVFSTMEALAKFLLTSEDLIFESILEKEK